MHTAKDDTLELIRTFLPKYLIPELQENLFKTVQEYFPFSTDPNLIYSNLPDLEYYYQGDCLIDIPFSSFNQGSFNTAYISGIIVSNSCDISPDNDRIETPYIQFSSVFSLEEYISLLRKREISEKRIESFIENLKGNRISNLFYLPEKKNGNNILLEESFVRFDMNVTLPVSIFNGDNYNNNYAPDGDRLFSFSNYGFYLFLIKLSVHYCRFREGVFRNK
ncbi:MAG: hypothetical protein ACP5D9_08750 [Mariniphaga sp.]